MVLFLALLPLENIFQFNSPKVLHTFFFRNFIIVLQFPHMRKYIFTLLLVAGVVTLSQTPLLSQAQISGNVPPPINVSDQTQYKHGLLELNVLRVGSLGIFSPRDSGYDNEKFEKNKTDNDSKGVRVATDENMGANRYCDQYGQNCISSAAFCAAFPAICENGNTPVATCADGSPASTGCVTPPSDNPDLPPSSQNRFMAYIDPRIDANGKQEKDVNIEKFCADLNNKKPTKVFDPDGNGGNGGWFDADPDDDSTYGGWRVPFAYEIADFITDGCQLTSPVKKPANNSCGNNVNGYKIKTNAREYNTNDYKYAELLVDGASRPGFNILVSSQNTKGAICVRGDFNGKTVQEYVGDDLKVWFQCGNCGAGALRGPNGSKVGVQKTNVTYNELFTIAKISQFGSQNTLWCANGFNNSVMSNTGCNRHLTCKEKLILGIPDSGNVKFCK